MQLIAKRTAITTLPATIGLTVVLALAASFVAAVRSGAAEPPAQQGSAQASDAKPPSDAELLTRTTKLIENQHNDDAALDVYERTEHHLDQAAGASPRVLLDKTYRVVPTGGGAMKIVTADHGMPVGAEEYRRQMEMLRGILEFMANPNDSRGKAAYEKYQKRQHDRADFVETARNAFLVKWQDRETFRGRASDVFLLTPDPNFHPHSMFQGAMAHVTAKIWVDRETGQLARGEADVTSDIYFGGGILGKLTKGSKVSLDQVEVAQGIWLPTRYEYNYSGRKFLFSFEQHQTIDATNYRRIGPPGEALAAVQRELASGKPVAGDP
jgi:hypothetical protein